MHLGELGSTSNRNVNEFVGGGDCGRQLGRSGDVGLWSLDADAFAGTFDAKFVNFAVWIGDTESQAIARCRTLQSVRQGGLYHGIRVHINVTASEIGELLKSIARSPGGGRAKRALIGKFDDQDPGVVVIQFGADVLQEWQVVETRVLRRAGAAVEATFAGQIATVNSWKSNVMASAVEILDGIGDAGGNPDDGLGPRDWV